MTTTKKRNLVRILPSAFSSLAFAARSSSLSHRPALQPEIMFIVPQISMPCARPMVRMVGTTVRFPVLHGSGHFLLVVS